MIISSQFLTTGYPESVTTTTKGNDPAEGSIASTECVANATLVSGDLSRVCVGGAWNGSDVVCATTNWRDFLICNLTFMNSTNLQDLYATTYGEIIPPVNPNCLAQASVPNITVCTTSRGVPEGSCAMQVYAIPDLAPIFLWIPHSETPFGGLTTSWWLYVDINDTYVPTRNHSRIGNLMYDPAAEWNHTSVDLYLADDRRAKIVVSLVNYTLNATIDRNTWHYITLLHQFAAETLTIFVNGTSHGSMVASDLSAHTTFEPRIVSSTDIVVADPADTPVLMMRFSQYRIPLNTTQVTTLASEEVHWMRAVTGALPAAATTTTSPAATTTAAATTTTAVTTVAPTTVASDATTTTTAPTVTSGCPVGWYGCGCDETEKFATGLGFVIPYAIASGVALLAQWILVGLNTAALFRRVISPAAEEDDADTSTLIDRPSGAARRPVRFWMVVAVIGICASVVVHVVLVFVRDKNAPQGHDVTLHASWAAGALALCACAVVASALFAQQYGSHICALATAAALSSVLVSNAITTTWDDSHHTGFLAYSIITVLFAMPISIALCRLKRPGAPISVVLIMCTIATALSVVMFYRLSAHPCQSGVL